MEKLTSKKALELLTEGIILQESDYQKHENRWINHCINVGEAAGRIAERLNLDSDHAKTLGYIHANNEQKAQEILNQEIYEISEI